MEEKANKNLLYKLSNLKLKKSIVGLFFAVISVLSYQVLYLFILFLVLALLFSLMGIIDKQKFGYIVILLIILSIIGYLLYYKPKYVDPNYGDNILIGTWEYNSSGGTYVFNEDKTYYQYVSKDTKDNYCFGKYKYYFGYEGENGNLLLSDDKFLYYSLILHPSKCIITGQEDNSAESKYVKNMVFGYAKYDVNDSALLNVRTENIVELNKLK